MHIIMFAYILEQEIPSPAFVQRLDPVNSARRGVDYCRPGCTFSDKQRIDTDVVRSDPKRIHGLLWVQLD